MTFQSFRVFGHRKVVKRSPLQVAPLSLGELAVSDIINNVFDWFMIQKATKEINIQKISTIF
jgi:hypothetical protein